MFSPDGSKHPCRRHHATLHGVVFDILVWASTASPKRKAPPCGGAILALAQFRFELAISLRTGILALTARVLLLLARLLAAALLLAGLLARVLILLARVLVRVAHSGSPLLNATARQQANPGLVSEELRFHRDHCVALVRRNCGPGTPDTKTSTVQAL